MSEMISRRSFLKVAGISAVGVAAFGLTGCGGGGGGSSSTDTVYGMVTNAQLDNLGIGDGLDFSELTEKQKEGLAKIVPACKNVWFPLDDVSALSSETELSKDQEEQLGQIIGANNDIIILEYGVINQSTSVTVNFERSKTEFQNGMQQILMAVATAEDKTKTAYQSKDFTVKYDGKVQPAISCGYASTGESGEGAVSENYSATSVAPKGQGVMKVYAIVPKGWSTLDVTYTPSFDKGTTFKYRVKSTDVDVDNGDDE